MDMDSNESQLWQRNAIDRGSSSFKSSISNSGFPMDLTTAAPLLLEAVTTTTATVLRNVTESPEIVEKMNFLKGVYQWLIPVMIIVLLVAIVGNGLICVASPFMSSPVSPYLKLCVSLAAADLWAATLLIIGLLVNSYFPVVLGYPKHSFCPDAWLEVFRVSGMLTSDLHLFALAINQFFGTMWPLKYKVMITTRRIRALILLLWLVPMVILIICFMADPNDGLRQEHCRLIFYNRFPFRIGIFLIFFFPLIATLAIYVTILIKLLKAKAEFDNSCHAERRLNCRRSNVQSKLKLVWTTLLIVSSFALSWGICVLYFVLVCQEGCMFTYLVDVDFYLGLFLNASVQTMSFLKLASNPLLYTLRIRAFRTSVNTLLGYCWRKRRYPVVKRYKGGVTLISTNSTAPSSV